MYQVIDIASPTTDMIRILAEAGSLKDAEMERRKLVQHFWDEGMNKYNDETVAWQLQELAKIRLKIRKV